MLLKKNIAVLAVAAILLASCGTSVTLTVKRTPNMNTSGIDRVAIMPFTGSSQAQQQEAAKVLTQKATTKIQGTNHFTLVDAAQIQALQKSGASIADQVDALFTGQVTSLTVNSSSRVVERTDKDGNKYNVTIYEKRMDMAFSYSFVRARDGSIIGVIPKTGSSSSSVENDSSRLLTDSQMITRIVDRELRYLERDVAPYTLTVKRGMMPEKNKDKMLQAKMKNANTMVKDGAYKQAIDAFLNTYDQYGNLAAGYNASVLYEATGDLSEAYGLIEFLYGEFPGNKNVKTYMAELKRIISDQELLGTVFVKGAATAKQKVTDLAIAKILEAVPTKGTKIWVMNNTPVANTNERKLAGDVVDNVAPALQKGGLVLVDRENTQLIDMEQKFQMSGAVSDNDFMSIGNAAGASILINISVVGTGNTRRLQVQVTDMEKRTTVFRSDASADWNI